MSTTNESMVDEARRVVLGERNESYGDPRDDYLKTAKIWSGLLAHKLKADISPEEAMLLMVGLKLSREVHRHKRDNIVDAHGYLLCYEWAISGVKPNRDT
jgi:hypothetical protein